MKGKVHIRNKMRPGDLEKILKLHVSFYSEEHGFNEDFVKYVRETLEEFDRPHSSRENTWIVEIEGEMIGCLAVVEHSEKVAQMRWFLVHPYLRGHGIGGRIFQEAIEFIERSGYSSAFLFTQSILVDAANIYERNGFEVVEEKVEEMWGQKLIGQRYERKF